MNLELVDLSRLQFALTALYHFLFVPLTLGMSFLLAITESLYVATNKTIWREITKFWGVLFGINFVMGVSTGITMEFQFGTNWAYYSHYVGDIFGVPLAIEGLMAFFLEGTMVGIFFFGWDRMSKKQHLVVTWLVALGTNLSALWILIANGWMQHPVGSYFNFHTMRMEVADFWTVLFNPVAQAKFFHTISAGYLTGAMFMAGVSCFYLLRNRNIEMMKRSLMVASAFGLAASIFAIVMGDTSGYLAGKYQPMKVAAIEAEWNTQQPPAAFNLIAWPDQASYKNDFAVQIPDALGLILTHSKMGVVPGINQLVQATEEQIAKGIKAYVALQTLEKNPNDKKAQALLQHYSNDLGYGMLLLRFTNNVAAATPAQIHEAALSTVPNVAPLFWGFRIMVGLGFLMFTLLILAFVFSYRDRILQNRWFMRLMPWCIPLPWLALECGWFVAEYGRQPWVIQGVMPTFMGASSLNPGTVLTSISGYVLLYSFLFVIEMYLMLKYIRLGPEYFAYTNISKSKSIQTAG